MLISERSTPVVDAAASHRVSGVTVTHGQQQQQQLHGRLELAGRQVDKHMQQDSAFPHLVDQLRVTAQGPPEVSGLHDNDYPNMPSIGLEALAQLAAVKRIPLPAELVEQFAHMQCNCTMGLFTEIGRAWLTIDSNIFVWTYEDGGDVAYFDGLGETILGVGLVKPKNGIFQRHIKYLLCLTTPSEVVLLGVSFSKTVDDVSVGFGSCEMHLLPPLFSLPSDNTFITTVVGTDNGRIFLGGKDGCLYEIVYRAEEGWFSRKCQKVNHSSSSLSFFVPSFLSFAFSEEDPLVQIEVDNSRAILYTRTEKGTITVYDLGSDGWSTSRVTAVSQNTIVYHATSAARTIDQTNFFPLVNISAIEAQDSAHIHLVVVTHAGVRLYFTVLNLNNPQCSRPVTLQLVHVRLPPGFSAMSPPVRPSRIHTVHYRGGTLLMAASHTDESDMLWCLNNDSFPFQHQMMETQATVPIEGRTWALSEVPALMHVAVPVAVRPPVVVTQHQSQPQKFILISAQGSHIISKLRPVDQLRQLLLDFNGSDCDAVRAFFRLHDEDQTCAMCLILACSSSVQDKQVAEWATRAFFLFGNEPKLSFHFPGSVGGSTPVYTTSSPQQNWMATPGPSSPTTGAVFHTPDVQSFHPRQISTPKVGYQNVSVGHQSGNVATPSTPLDFQYSGKHNGLVLFFSRIVRPFWEERLVQDVPCESADGINYYLISSVMSSELTYYIEQLSSLRMFLLANRTALLPLTNNTVSSVEDLPLRIDTLMRAGESSLMSQQQTQKKLNIEAQLQEKSSILNIQQLVECTIEVLGLWKILYDHQFHVITSNLSKDHQNQLRSMVFKDLIINGQQLASVLVASLIGRYLGDNATTDAISARLREVCPSIYRAEDATFSKANELLMQAQKEKNRHEKEQQIQEAIQLCKQVVPQVNMPIICQHLQAVCCFDGIVDLCLLAAVRRDPQNLSLHYYHNGERTEDQQGYQAFISRMECYKYITDTLAQLTASACGVPHSASIPRIPGPQPAVDVPALSQEEAHDYFERVLQMSLQSDDEMFHVAVFNWLMEQKMEEKLLDLKSPYLEGYLKRAASHYDNSLATLDLLWKHYEKVNNYGSASKILAKLADKHGNDVSLQQRIEYLSRAIVCLKSAEVLPGSRSEGEHLHELEEKMEVARIQMQVLDALLQLNTRETKDAIGCLNADLMDITRLYEEFAQPYNLHECQLAIIHCAGLHDTSLVETLWLNIINKELDDRLHLSTETRVLTLGNKLKSLGKIYVSSHKYFPLPFLIKVLEGKSIALNLDPKWVFNTMLTVGISLPRLLDVYDRFYKASDPQWLLPKKSLHIQKVLSLIVASFAECHNAMAVQERRRCTIQFLDVISAHLIDLQSQDATSNQDIRAIIDSLRDSQIRLERSV